MLTGEVSDLRSPLRLFQDPDDLGFCESAFSHGVLQGRLYPVFLGTAGPIFWGCLTRALERSSPARHAPKGDARSGRNHGGVSSQYHARPTGRLLGGLDATVTLHATRPLAERFPPSSAPRIPQLRPELRLALAGLPRIGRVPALTFQAWPPLFQPKQDHHLSWNPARYSQDTRLMGATASRTP